MAAITFQIFNNSKSTVYYDVNGEQNEIHAGSSKPVPVLVRGKEDLVLWAAKSKRDAPRDCRIYFPMSEGNEYGGNFEVNVFQKEKKFFLSAVHDLQKDVLILVSVTDPNFDL